MEVLFIISSIVCLLGTVLLLLHRNAVYGLLGLLVAFFGSAGIFRSLDAPFVAVAQVLVYAGALAVMFLFVLMFTDTRTALDRSGLPLSVGSRVNFKPEDVKKLKDEQAAAKPASLMQSVQLPQPLAAVIALAFFACLAFAIYKLPESTWGSFGELPASYETGLLERAADGTTVDRKVGYGSTSAISFTIFEGFPLAFEVVSLLIFAAVLGAVLLARRHLEGLAGVSRPERKGGDSHNQPGAHSH